VALLLLLVVVLVVVLLWGRALGDAGWPWLAGRCSA
jgi:hypothetical protein